jgi:uncharacterized protein (DUF1501 family)
MKCQYSCQSVDHVMSRRGLLRGAVAGIGAAAGANLLLGQGASWVPAGAAEQLRSTQKRILTFWLHGGLSQLESWDPKPNTVTGGPTRTISTSVPGLHISDLLPYTAKQMHRLALVRSLNTRQSGHGQGQVAMTTGRDIFIPGLNPHLGAVAAKCLTPDKFALPGHILVRGAGMAGGTGAYLGPRFSAVTLEEGKAPQNSTLPATVGGDAEARRQAFRAAVDDRFAARRRTADTDAYTYSYDQAQDLMTRRDVFDVEKESAADRAKYGNSEFGRHCLLARRLLENDVPFVQVNHNNYDTHYENFDYCIEQLGEFDRPFATLVDDLAERGMLKDTLIVVMSEMGRTPKINPRYGRDHWGTAFSVCLGGAGIQPGAVFGKTNATGTQVAEDEVDHGRLFHTYLSAVGVDTSKHFVIGGRKYPIADPAKHPIKELLA